MKARDANFLKAAIPVMEEPVVLQGNNAHNQMTNLLSKLVSSWCEASEKGQPLVDKIGIFFTKRMEKKRKKKKERNNKEQKKEKEKKREKKMKCFERL